MLGGRKEKLYKEAFKQEASMRSFSKYNKETAR